MKIAEHSNSDPDTLSPATVAPQSDEFGRLDAKIDQGIRTLEENSFLLGSLLRRMKTSKLYKVRYRRWQDYLDAKTEIGRQHAWRLVKAAEIIELLEEKMSPRGDILLPSTETQIRELRRLKEIGDQVKAWEEAVAASGGNPTVAEVAAAVKKFLPAPQNDEQKNPDDAEEDTAEDDVSITRRNIAGWESVKLADGSVRKGALCPSGCIPAAVARDMITQLATTFDRLEFDPKTQVAIQHIATDIVAMVNLATSGDGGDQIVKGLKHLLRNVLAEIRLKSEG